MKVKKLSLQAAFEMRYQHLVSDAEFSATDSSICITIQFKNPKYSAWISDEGYGFIVGIDALHSHLDYDSDSEQDWLETLQRAFEALDDILEGREVVVGHKNSKEPRLVATTSPELAIEEYGRDSSYEIVAFSDPPKE